MDIRKAALSYTRQNGMRPPLGIFPLVPGDKTPIFPGGFHAATTDEAQIKKWWSEWPHANIGFHCDGIIVLDIDRHDPSADGFDSLRELERQYGELPETWICETPSGGEHYYFRCNDQRLTSGAGIAPGIDYRGSGGYVLLPPSVHPNGGVYEWEAGHTPKDTPLADLPEWLHDLLLTEKISTGRPEPVPEKIPRGQRNDTLYKMACSLRGKSCSEKEITSLLQTMNAERCDPPLSDDEISQIAASAAKYKAGTLPTYSQQADPVQAEPVDEFGSFNFYTLTELTEEDRKPPEFLIQDMVPVGLTFISGAPKIRKSFMALQMAYAVATGTEFLGKKTLQCDVAYLDLEGSKNRIANRADTMNLNMPGNVFITNRITDKISGRLIEKIQNLHHQKPSIRLVIIDTYSRARGNIRTGNANAYDADVSILEPIQQMALDENIAILFVHHDKKGAGMMADSFERINGTMGISGSADSVLNLIATGKRFEGVATLEYNPRDVKGGEMRLHFNDYSCQWEREIAPPDIRGNPIIRACIESAPKPHHEGVFCSYSSIYRAAYNTDDPNPGDKIRAVIKEHGDELYSKYGYGIQLGVQSKNVRGIRIFNCN